MSATLDPKVLSLMAMATLLVGRGSAQHNAWTPKREQAITALATRWWQARPATKFESWDPSRRSVLLAEATRLGTLPEGKFARVVQLLWAPVAEFGPGIVKERSKKGGKLKTRRPKWLPKLKNTRKGKFGKRNAKATLATPYGEAWFYLNDPGRKRTGLILGLHGGGEGAGSASEPRGTWRKKDCVGFYPQGIRLVHDTWNTVHGERFILTMIEIAKAHFGIDPDRVYSMGFSMGGSGSWFMAGRHADLLAGAAPCAGVLMASPKSQLARLEDVRSVQHGLVPNVRNLAMYYYIGLADKNCMPGTYLYVERMLEKLRQDDPGGYDKIRFKTYPGLAHAQPPGEPKKLLAWLPKQKRETFPKVVVWETATNPFPQPDNDPVVRLPKTTFYWLGCHKLEDAQKIRAELDGKKNTIRIQVSRRAMGTAGITIYLNPEMIDVTKPITVTSASGKVLYHGKPTPNLRTMLETLDARVDRRMVFDRRIVL